MPPPSFHHGKVCSNVAFALGMHVRPNDLGHIVTNDSGVVTERNPDSVRGADVAYYSYQRLPKDAAPRMYPAVPPELVFEVMSPDDVFQDLMAKVDEYLAAGVSLVFVLDPGREQAVLYEKGYIGTVFRREVEMPFPGLFPDLRIPSARSSSDRPYPTRGGRATVGVLPPHVRDGPAHALAAAAASPPSCSSPPSPPSPPRTSRSPPTSG